MNCSATIHPSTHCVSFITRGWINCESDGSKKVSKDLKGTKKISGVQRPWHCQVRLITADMMGRLIFGTGDAGRKPAAHSPALSTSLVCGWITKCTHGVCNRAGDPEFAPAPSITSTSSSKQKVLLFHPQSQTWALLGVSRVALI